jgi:hypothetical protein
MTAPMTARRIAVWALALGMAGLGGACASSSDDTGRISFALSFEDAGWFQLRVFEGPVTELLTPAAGGRQLFDTGCLEIRSRTFEITDLEVGAGRSVVFEAFTGADCRREARVSLGYRGEITVVKPPAEQPYYHVPSYDFGAVTALPEDINLSASLAVKVDLCETDAECADKVSPGGGCFKIGLPDASGSNFWCVPTCKNSADCETIHPQAVCDAEAGWCVLRSPFPLNMSEPRAFGGALETGDGSVLLAGGFGSLVGGSLLASERAFERFDAATGLFERAAIDGLPSTAVGLSGFAKLGTDRFAQVGGALSVSLAPGKPAAGFTLQFGALGGDTCTADGCEPNITDRVLVFDTARGRGTVTRLPVRLAMPAVVATADEILIFGGATPTGSGDATERSREVWRCEVTDSISATCDKLVDMAVARAGAAASCLDPACEQVLVVGGNGAGAGIEVIDRSDGAPQVRSFTGPGSLGTVFGPLLCGSRLIGGGVGTISAGGLGFTNISTDNGFRIEPLETQGQFFAPLFGAAAMQQSDDCWLAGGIDPQGTVLATVRRITTEAVAPDELRLSTPRFGAMAATMSAGPLAGSVVFAGGLGIQPAAEAGEAGRVVFVRGAEVLRP